MEFKHLNQPDFDREREGVVKELLIKLRREHPQTYCPEGASYRYSLEVARLSYNEGFKACLEFIQKEYWNPDIPDTIFEGLLEEVDKIDKENG